MKTDISGVQVVLDDIHHRIHQGQLYSASVSGTLAAAATLSMTITAPPTHKIHAEFFIGAGKSGSYIVAKGDVISGGSAVTGRNFNTLYPDDTITITKDATRDTPGTTMKGPIVIGAGGPQNIGGNDGTRKEFVIKQGTTLTILFTADAIDTDVSIDCDYYKVPA